MTDGGTWDAARFATGLTYDGFKAAMTRNLDRLQAAEAAAAIDPRDIAHFRSLRPIHIAAIVEDWCGDVLGLLPVAAVLAREVGPAIELRCFIKDEHPGIIEPYLNRGRYESVPVFAVLDSMWREVGAVIERPAAVTERRDETRRAIHAEHPEFGSPDEPAVNLPDDVRADLQARILRARAEQKPWEDRRFVLALRDVSARAAEVGESAPPTRA